MATSRETVELLTKFMTTGEGDVSDAFDDIDDSLDKAGNAATSTGSRFTELASKLDIAKQAFGFVQQGAQVAFDALERGTEVAQTASTFDSLTVAIGTTSDIMIGSLRVATQGMVSDFDLMQSANRFMAMGLAATADEAAELSKVATTLGAAMGVGPTQAMEDFALLLANQSIPRLDTFGISSGKVKLRIAELTTGVNALDRETAFMQATMEAASDTMADVGGEVDELTRSMAQLDVAQKNLTDRASVGFAQKMAPSVVGLSNVVSAYSKAQADANRAVEIGIIKSADITRIVEGSAFGFKNAQEELKNLREELEEYDNALKFANESTESSDKALLRVGSTVEKVAEETEELIEAQTELDKANLAVITSGQRYAEQGATMADVNSNLAKSIQFTVEQTNLAAQALSEGYTQAFEEALPLVDDYIQAQADMNEASGEWVSVTRDNASEIADINAQLFGDLDSDQKAAARDMVDNAEEGGAEWLAGFNTLQGDLSQSQREALVLRRSELEASQGDIASVYTGDVEAFKAAQAAKLEAEMAFTAQLQENAFSIAEARIIAEGGDVIGNTEALLNLAVAQGIKTQEQADLQLIQTERVIQTQEVTQALMDIYLSDGVLAQEESERLANAVGLIGEGADLTTEQLVALGVAGTENAGMVTTAMELTNTSIIDASGSVDTLAVKLAMLPEMVEVDIVINATGAIPGSGNASEVMEQTGTN